MTRNGVVEWVDWIGGPLRDAEGKIVGVTNLAIDITDRKLSEMALEAQQRSSSGCWSSCRMRPAT